jgi:cell pole-organizing protein PopZ
MIVTSNYEITKKGGENMTGIRQIMTTDISMRIKSIADLKEVMNQITELRESYPYECFRISIELEEETKEYRSKISDKKGIEPILEAGSYEADTLALVRKTNFSEAMHAKSLIQATCKYLSEKEEQLVDENTLGEIKEAVDQLIEYFNIVKNHSAAVAGATGNYDLWVSAALQRELFRSDTDK